jgi:hypothetical protein
MFHPLFHPANERGLKAEVRKNPGTQDEGQLEEGDNILRCIYAFPIALFVPLSHQPLYFPALVRASTSMYCVVVYPTASLIRGFTWMFFSERNAGEQPQTSRRRGGSDLTDPKLYRCAFRPSFTLSNLLEVDPNLTFEHSP